MNKKLMLNSYFNKLLCLTYVCKNGSSMFVNVKIQFNVNYDF